MHRLTDHGSTIGYIADHEVNGCEVVLDENQRTVGYIKDNATYDASWRKVADFGDAGLLLND